MFQLCYYFLLEDAKDKMLVGNSILEHLKWQNSRIYFPSSIMHIWKEDTLKCLGNNLLKVYSVVSGKERLLIFDQ